MPKRKDKPPLTDLVISAVLDESTGTKFTAPRWRYTITQGKTMVMSVNTYKWECDAKNAGFKFVRGIAMRVSD